MTAPSRKPDTFAPVTVFVRKIRNGTIGDSCRDSITRNVASRAPEAISSPIVRPLAQPTSGAFEIAYTRSARCPVAVIAPPASKPRRPVMRLSRTSGRVSVSTSAPTGTLTKKIHSQPAYFVRMPPISTPAAAPLPAMAPQIPSALLRSAPSSNVVVMIESVAGEMIAAPMPCTARAATSTPIEPASPQASEAAENSASPAMNIRRRPSRSAARPPSSSKPPNVIV